MRDGHVFALTPKEALLLRALVAARGAVVSKAALLDLAWPDEDVSEASLTTCVHTLRAHLVGPGRTEACIGTVYGRGYRITVPVTSVGGEYDTRLSALERASVRVREAYLEARVLFRARTPDRLTRGVALCEQAIAWDPDFTPAYVLLAECLGSAVFMTALPRAAALARINALLAHARQVDPETPGLDVIETATRSAFYWEFASAEARFDHALARAPSDTIALGFYARHLYGVGQTARRAQVLRRLLDVDPLHRFAPAAYGHALLCDGRPEEAIVRVREAVAAEASTSALAYHALVSSSAGRLDEAVMSADALLATARQAPIATMIAAEVFARTGRTTEARVLLDEADAAPEWRAPTFAAAAAFVLDGEDVAVRWLERALALRDVWLPGARVEPRFAALLARPRARAVVNRISAVAAAHV